MRRRRTGTEPKTRTLHNDEGKNRNLPQFVSVEPHFVRKGCVSWRLVGTAPRLKREIEKKEKEECKRAREPEDKRARGQEGKREKMSRCEDVKI